MSGGTHGLGRLQQWMQAVIIHPQGVREGIASSEARRHIDIEAAQVGEVIRPSQALSSVERLHIYGNAYYARLLECLGQEFPALKHAVGDEAFAVFAFGYLQRYPSQSYTLADLGRRFPAYLCETRPTVEADQAGQSGWPDFLIDLATLERTYSEVFDGPGPEDGQILKPDDLAAIPAEEWPVARLVLVPCFRLLRPRFAVHEYASAVRRHEAPSPPQAEATYLAITRRDYVVRRYPLLREQYELLAALVEGLPVGEAILRAVESSAANLDTLAAQLQGWFRQWAAAPFFRAVERSN